MTDTVKEKLNAEIRLLRERVAQLEQLVAECRMGQGQPSKISLCSLTQYANDLIILLDDNFRFLETSEGVINFYGYTREELIGMHATDFRAPETKHLFEEQIKPVYLKDVVVYETVHQRKDGTKFPVEISLRAINIEGKRLYYAIVRNITERKLIESELRQSEERYRELIEGTEDLITVIDRQGKFIYVNCAAERIFGLKPQECVGLLAFDFIHPDDRQRTKDAFQGWVRDKVAHVSYNNRQVNKNGQVFELDWSINPHFDSSGEIVDIFSIAHDITKRRNAEQALISKTALLEAQINSTLDGLLVVDENQKRILTNHRLVGLFNIPQDILGNSDDTLLLKHVVSLTKYPEKFLEKVTYLYDHPSEISRDEIEFKSGMILDRYSAPVLGSDGKSYGRIWIFRDITERKKLEAESKGRLRELEVFYKVAMGREERIIELKKEIGELKKKLDK